jgi:hypothetical protein
MEGVLGVLAVIQSPVTGAEVPGEFALRLGSYAFAFSCSVLSRKIVVLFAVPQ